jgi:hypothetical protein
LGNYISLTTNLTIGAGGLLEAGAAGLVTPFVLVVQRIAENGLSVTANGAPGAIFYIQTATNLNPPALWHIVSTNIADNTGLVQFIDRPTTVDSMRLYRLVTSATPPGAPAFVQQPAGQAVLDGMPTSFTAVVSGALPLQYQWYYSSTTVEGATNASLNIPRVGKGTIGSYQLVARNSFGSVTSSVVSLRMVVPTTATAQ